MANSSSAKVVRLYPEDNNGEFNPVAPSNSYIQKSDDTIKPDIPEPPPWFHQAVKRMYELSSLEENWDSYGAKAINRNVLLSALNTILTIVKPGTPEPSIVPVPTGHVQYEWHTKGIDLEIEFISTSKLEVYFEDTNTGDEWEGTIVSDLSTLTGFIAKLS